MTLRLLGYIIKVRHDFFKFMYNKIIAIFFSVTSMAFFSCSNNIDTGKEKLSDSLQSAMDIAAEDSSVIFENRSDEWIKKYFTSGEWKWSGMHLTEFWGIDNPPLSPYKPDKDFYKNYGPLLRWSPDSAFILDLGTYSAVIIKDKEGKPAIASGDIDTQIFLLMPKAGAKKEILFFGSSANIIDAHWINSAQVGMIGIYEEKENRQIDTLLWLFDTDKNFFRKYKWK